MFLAVVEPRTQRCIRVDTSTADHIDTADRIRCLPGRGGARRGCATYESGCIRLYRVVVVLSHAPRAVYGTRLTDGIRDRGIWLTMKIIRLAQNNRLTLFDLSPYLVADAEMVSTFYRPLSQINLTH